MPQHSKTTSTRPSCPKSCRWVCWRGRQPACCTEGWGNSRSLCPPQVAAHQLFCSPGEELWALGSDQVHTPGGPGHHILRLGLGPGECPEHQVLQAESSRRARRLRKTLRQEAKNHLRQQTEGEGTSLPAPGQKDAVLCRTVVTGPFCPHATPALLTPCPAPCAVQSWHSLPRCRRGQRPDRASQAVATPLSHHRQCRGGWAGVATPPAPAHRTQEELTDFCACLLHSTSCSLVLSPGSVWALFWCRTAVIPSAHPGSAGLGFSTCGGVGLIKSGCFLTHSGPGICGTCCPALHPPEASTRCHSPGGAGPGQLSLRLACQCSLALQPRAAVPRT